MYKTTSKSMQKAWGRDIPRKKPVLRSPRARATADELIEFETSEMPKDVLLDRLRPVVKGARSSTNLRPGQLAKLLNAKGYTTAQGRRWNERRVILLLRLLAEQSTRRRLLKTQAVPGPQRTSTTAKEPLSPEEVARRLGALGRIKTG